MITTKINHQSPIINHQLLIAFVIRRIHFNVSFSSIHHIPKRKKNKTEPKNQKEDTVYLALMTYYVIDTYQKIPHKDTEILKDLHCVSCFRELINLSTKIMVNLLIETLEREMSQIEEESRTFYKHCLLRTERDQRCLDWMRCCWPSILTHSLTLSGNECQHTHTLSLFLIHLRVMCCAQMLPATRTSTVSSCWYIRRRASESTQEQSSTLISEQSPFRGI